MVWLERYRQASFKGVPFKVQSADTQFGRRTVKHQYPGKDTPFIEDLGKEGREFTVDAIVIGDNYFDDRDAIIKVCEEGGKGTLIHPYLGTSTVVCTAISINESVQNGRMATISLSFVEAGLQQFPSGSVNLSSSVGIASDSVIDLAKVDFIAKTVVENVPQFVRDPIGATKKIVGEQLNVLSVTGTDIDELANYRSFVDKMLDETFSLTDTTSLADLISGSISQINNVSKSPREALFHHQNFFEVDVIQEPKGTPLRRIARTNQKAVQDVVSRTAVAEAVRNAEATEFETFEEATEFQQDLSARIDTLQENTEDDNMYQSLDDLRTQLVNAVPPPDEKLPRLVNVASNKTQASLALSYELYDDVDREAEIVERNSIKHPGFILGGRPLEVKNK